MLILLTAVLATERGAWGMGCAALPALVGLTDAVDGALLAMAACGPVALGVALVLPRGAPEEVEPALLPADQTRQARPHDPLV